MSFKEFIKDPDAVVDYLFKWQDWLGTSETITSQTVTIETGIVLDSDTIVDSSKNVVVFLSGGSVENVYTVSCLINTNEARTDERSFLVRVAER